jgi:hypothetical protein
VAAAAAAVDAIPQTLMWPSFAPIGHTYCFTTYFKKLYWPQKSKKLGATPAHLGLRRARRRTVEHRGSPDNDVQIRLKRLSCCCVRFHYCTQSSHVNTGFSSDLALAKAAWPKAAALNRLAHSPGTRVDLRWRVRDVPRLGRCDITAFFTIALIFRLLLLLLLATDILRGSTSLPVPQ